MDPLVAEEHLLDAEMQETVAGREWPGIKLVEGCSIGGISAPVLAVIAIIGVLVAAFATLWNTNEEFREKITAIWKILTKTRAPS